MRDNAPARGRGEAIRAAGGALAGLTLLLVANIEGAKGPRRNPSRCWNFLLGQP